MMVNFKASNPEVSFSDPKPVVSTKLDFKVSRQYVDFNQFKYLSFRFMIINDLAFARLSVRARRFPRSIQIMP